MLVPPPKLYPFGELSRNPPRLPNPIGEAAVGNAPIGYPILGYPKPPADAPADALADSYPGIRAITWYRVESRITKIGVET